MCNYFEKSCITFLSVSGNKCWLKRTQSHKKRLCGVVESKKKKKVFLWILDKLLRTICYSAAAACLTLFIHMSLTASVSCSLTGFHCCINQQIKNRSCDSETYVRMWVWWNFSRHFTQYHHKLQLDSDCCSLGFDTQGISTGCGNNWDVQSN